jgi:Zn-dependent protease with chaperone function
MTIHRLIALCLLVVLLIGGLALVASSKVEYRVDFTSIVKIWGDIVRDADKVGLTITRVSEREEMELGAGLAKQTASRVVSDPQLQKYVFEVGSRLVNQVRRKGIKYRFRIIDTPSINAFALPGGNIYITLKMFDFVKSEAEIAAILAHEISHVDLRHCIERFQYELAARRILPPDLAAIATIPYTLLIVAYSEQQEREADVDAIIMMAKAGYHPKYALAPYDRMDTHEEGTRRARPPVYATEELSTAALEALKEYFKTHPSWPMRIKEITGALQRNASDWQDQDFYVGRSNLAQLTSWTTQAFDAEVRPYIEPPAYVDYMLPDRYPAYKAMATHLPSGLSGVASNEATPSAAIDRARSECENKIKPCELYALGDTMVLNMPQREIEEIASKYLGASPPSPITPRPPGAAP